MNTKRLFWIITTLLALLGAASLVWRLYEGMRMSALSSTITWGMWVAFYIYFIGLSAGSFLFSTLIYVFGMTHLEKAGRMALVSALFALFGGLCFVWIDLGHPFRFWRVFYNWHDTSVLAWESMFYIFYIAIVAAELFFLMRIDLAEMAQEATGWKKTLYRRLSLHTEVPADESAYRALKAKYMKVVKVLGICGLPVAIGVHGGTGALFAVVVAKPYWFGPLFPIIFIVSALVSGAALTVFLYAFFSNKEDRDYLPILKGLANYLILFIAIDLLLLVAEFLTNLYPNLPEHEEVLHEVLFGPYWYTFWIGQLGLGMILPILIVKLNGRHPKWIGIGGLCAVIGIVGVRLNLVIPAFIVPVVKGMDEAYIDPRWTFHYFPSLGEWATSIGVIALIVWGFAVAWKLLPIFSEVESGYSHEAA